MSALLSVAALYSLSGKVAVVTGAASNIGKATAILFADAGATVVLADKDEDGAAAVAATLGGGHGAIGFDLAEEASIAALFAEVKARHGGCDILVNSAGIFPKYPFDQLSRDQWDEMQRINIWGCFAVLREAARLMRAGGKGGRIINLSSIGGVRPAVDHQVAYNASKAALDSMTKYSAAELGGDRILVNSVCHGAVIPLDPKPRDPSNPPATGPLMSPGRLPIGSFAAIHEAVGPILMLASAAGGNITGQCLVIDGGFSVA